MAQRSAQPEVIVDVEEALEVVDKTMDRVKSLYEQYFLGIQKQPPTFIHNDLERKLRDLQQIQIRNTALRYRFATLQQKFGAYNSYWRRTLRQIENGTYVRSLAKISRKAIERGEDIPEEILAKMPKRMRDQVRRDREAALALAQRRHQVADGDFYDEYDTAATDAPPKPRVDARGAHVLDEGDADLDLDAYFAQVAAEEENEATTFSAPPTPRQPQPTGPANLRSATLGGLPRAQSPAVRAQTNPGLGPSTRSTGPMRAVTDPGAPDISDQPMVGAHPLGRPPSLPTSSHTGSVQRPPHPGGSGAMPAQRATGPMPTIPSPGDPRQSGAMPAIPRPGAVPAGSASQSGRMPAFAPSQGARPNPIAPGASQAKQVGVETLQGPFAREPSVAVPPRRSKRDTDVDSLSEATPTSPSVIQPQATPSRPSQPIARPPSSQPGMRPAPTPIPTRPPMPASNTPSRPSSPAMRPQRPPPGMTDDDVNALYAKYVKAKQAVGETTNAQTYSKLLNTINAQAPKIMEQYKAKGVDFSVVVKDNQVIIKAKPKP